MTPNNRHTPDVLSEEIRRQLGSPAMARYLSSLPYFTVESGLPERLRGLLNDLHRTESGARNGNRSRRV